MKLYLSAMYARRAEMETIADGLRALGFEIVSRWVYGGEAGLTREEIAEVDLEDVGRCDVLLAFTELYGTATTGGGRHVEFGYALALGKAVAIVGEPENVFHHYHKVQIYQTLQDMPTLDSWREWYGNQADPSASDQ